MNPNGEAGHGKSREITYKVGWKKGRIMLEDDIQHEAQTTQEAAPLPNAGPVGNAFRRLLAEAPVVSDEAITVYALVLPAVLFGISLLLLYLLLN